MEYFAHHTATHTESFGIGIAIFAVLGLILVLVALRRHSK